MKRSAIRVVLDNFEFVDAGKSDGPTASDQSAKPVTSTEKPKPQESFSEDNGFDEDVPFKFPQTTHIMAHSEILLLEKVDNLGSEGDVVKVRPGYARNFLLLVTRQFH